jgi:hypothetical protein
MSFRLPTASCRALRHPQVAAGQQLSWPMSNDPSCRLINKTTRRVTGMNLNGRVQVSVSRPIAAPAARIFRVLADPANHPPLDGSGMLRAAPDQPVLSQVGDTFTMAMYLPAIGDYLMLNRVIAFDQDRRIAWEPTPGDAATSRTADCRSARHRGTAGVTSSSLTVTPQSSPRYLTAPKPPGSCATPWRIGRPRSRPCTKHSNG